MFSVEIEKKEEKKYPWIGIFEDNTIVLFIKENEGTVLYSYNSTWETGRYSYSWVEEYFHPFHGKSL